MNWTSDTVLCVSWILCLKVDVNTERLKREIIHLTHPQGQVKTTARVTFSRSLKVTHTHTHTLQITTKHVLIHIFAQTWWFNIMEFHIKLFARSRIRESTCKVTAGMRSWGFTVFNWLPLHSGLIVRSVCGTWGGSHTHTHSSTRSYEMIMMTKTGTVENAQALVLWDTKSETTSCYYRKLCNFIT